MGYYTHYHLDIEKKDKQDRFYEPDDSIMEQIKQAFVEILGGGPYYYNHGFDDMIDGTVEWKWYNHENHMHELALAFPDIYFTLSGAGEERDDCWIKQFHGNEVYSDYAEIIDPQRKW